jgi:hypothetical protein
MNPDTGQFERLQQRHEEQLKALEHRFSRLHPRLSAEQRSSLIRPDGSPVPDHWAVFTVGELVTLKNNTFRVAYMNEGTLLLEPVKPTDALPAQDQT